MAAAVFPSGIGPANSDIAAAVAAPSAATIASTVAAAVPTISAINSSVATNASPFPTWTTIANGTNWNGTTTLNVSGLGSYKTLRIFYYFSNNNTSDCNLRFNGDTSQNYKYVTMQFSDSTYASGDSNSSNRFNLGYNSSSGQILSGFLEIENNGSTTGPKLWSGYTRQGYSSKGFDFKGMYTSNSVISSLSITSTTNVSDSSIYILGV